jgi:CDP-glucose 4,6-dehydratase
MKNLKIFKNKKIIVTGHTGFKGSWLTLWLSMMGAKIVGISLKPKDKDSHFELINLKSKIKNYYFNILDRKKFKKKILDFKPDYIFHLAAQSLINVSYKDPKMTWETNVNGVMNLLDSVLELKKKCICIIVTSDKCYLNTEKKVGYKENDKLGGKDIYSASKASSEILVNSYYNSFFKNKSKHVLTTVRAGNVIGGGDWNKGRVIPDCIQSLIKKKYAIIRNINSSRPWQHVVEIVYGYLKLAIYNSSNNKLNGKSLNFGPSHKNIYFVKDILREIKFFFSNFKWRLDKQHVSFLETNLLVLNSDKSYKYLKWKIMMNFKETIKKTLEWYDAYVKFYLYKNGVVDFNKISKDQITNYYKRYIKKNATR